MATVPLASVLLAKGPPNCPASTRRSKALCRWAWWFWLGQRCMVWLSLGIVAQGDEPAPASVNR